MRSIYYGIRNLIYYFPVIWRDRPYDYEYIYDLLYYKLRLMERLFRHDAMVADREEVANQISEVLKRLEILKDDDFESEQSYIEYLDEREKIKNELFDMIKNNIDGWWD